MTRLARRERASPRRETVSRESGPSPEAAEPEIACVDDDVEQDDAFGDPVRRNQAVFTMGRVLRMTRSAPNVAYKCCSKRCLHALEIQRPGWIARQRDKLRTLTQKRKASVRVRIALRVLNGPRSREGFQRKGGVPRWRRVRACVHGNRRRSVRKEGVHRVASAVCVLQFVSTNFLYGKPLKDARAAAARGAHSSNSNSRFAVAARVNDPGGVCCQQDCLGGNLIAGVDATEYWMVRAANTHTQLAKQVMIREFHRQFPGICRNAVQAVLGVSRDSITKTRGQTERTSAARIDRTSSIESSAADICTKRMLDFFRHSSRVARPVILAWGTSTLRFR